MRIIDTGLRLGAHGLLLAALLGGASNLALAQEQPAPTPAARPAEAKPEAKAPAPSKQPWSVACYGEPQSGKLICTMSQTLISQQNGQQIVSVTIGPDEKGAMIARFNLPHGIDLTKGVTVWADQGQPETIPIRTADQRGSYASEPLPEARLASWKKAGKLSASVETLAGDKVVFEISLAGFGAALAKL